mmetsp:Transcript_955/g.1699  ORF Transcript_955/g.1699 Transcript_955/m.1699 type:complete len:86 (+) Transcript_955:432-689(+)
MQRPIAQESVQTKESLNKEAEEKFKQLKDAYERTLGWMVERDNELRTRILSNWKSSATEKSQDLKEAEEGVGRKQEEVSHSFGAL